MDYSFTIGRLGDISYSLPENKVLELLGKPDFIEEEKLITDEIEETQKYYYNNLGINLNFYYYDKEYYGLSIFTDHIIFKGKNLYNLEKKQVLICIEDIYIEKKYHFDYEHETNSINEDFYDFTNIGLKLWFDDNVLSDVCISKPEDDN